MLFELLDEVFGSRHRQLAGVVLTDVRGRQIVDADLAREQWNFFSQVGGVGPIGVDQRHHLVGQVAFIHGPDQGFGGRIARLADDGNFLGTAQVEIHGAQQSLGSAGSLGDGGLNFDAKLRRMSFESDDLFHSHIGAMDACARGLKAAAAIIEDGGLDAFIDARYAGWDGSFGQDVLTGKLDLEAIATHAAGQPDPDPHSGRQEMLENLINRFV